MTDGLTHRRWGTVVIGGGQAGLATGYHLAQRNEDFVIVDASERIGDAWRKRWDSLRLFTPAQYDGLAGTPFPAPRGTFPTKDEMADYLEGYAAQHRLPVRSGVRVERLAPSASGFELATSAGRISADRVVVATGAHQLPKIPAFAADLDPRIHAIHSSRYASPRSVPEGDVLVVGAGTSGVEIALELAKAHRTSIAGRPTPHIPDALLRHAGGAYWWLISNVLTLGTPIGRKARPNVLRSGAPLIRVSVNDLDAAGVERVPRVAGVSDGRPRLEDGRVLPVTTIVWATGFRPDYGWIGLPITDESGWPATERGICRAAPGLYFVGMMFQYGLTSALIGGVSRDAEHVAAAIERARAARTTPSAIEAPGVARA